MLKPFSGEVPSKWGPKGRSGGRYRRHSHPHKFWWPSVEGFLDSGGSNFALSHWLSSSPLQYSRTTERVCDNVSGWLPLKMRTRPLRLRRITWPVSRGSKQLHFWNPRPQFAYSLYKFIPSHHTLARQRESVVRTTMKVNGKGGNLTPAPQKRLNRSSPKFVWVTTSVISTTVQNFIQIGRHTHF